MVRKVWICNIWPSRYIYKYERGTPLKIKERLKRFGEKNAETAIDPRTHPRVLFQPKPPAKIQEKIEQAKNGF